MSNSGPSPTPNPLTTSYQQISGATTPSTFSSPTPASGSASPTITRAALLTLSDTTVTAIEGPTTADFEVAVVDGTTLTFRAYGITVSDGDVVSVVFNGLADDTTTADFGPVTISSGQGSANGTSVAGVPAATISQSQASAASRNSSTAGVAGTAGGTGSAHVTGSSSTSVVQSQVTISSASGPAPSGSGSASSAAASSSSSSAATSVSTLGAGKMMVLLGLVGGLIVYWM